MISALLAAVLTFTATATGVEKGTPLEFMFACKNTDRDYETMFVIDGTVDEFWKGIEKAGIPRGQPIDRTRCRLWPVGVPLRLEPGLDTFVDSEMPEGLPLGRHGGNAGRTARVGPDGLALPALGGLCRDALGLGAGRHLSRL